MGFMEQIQKDINSSMRAILIDWLVEVSQWIHHVRQIEYTFPSIFLVFTFTMI